MRAGQRLQQQKQHQQQQQRPCKKKGDLTREERTEEELAGSLTP